MSSKRSRTPEPLPARLDVFCEGSGRRQAFSHSYIVVGNTWHSIHDDRGRTHTQGDEEVLKQLRLQSEQLTWQQQQQQKQQQSLSSPQSPSQQSQSYDHRLEHFPRLEHLNLAENKLKV